jgi:type VI secretion system protein ImpC
LHQVDREDLDAVLARFGPELTLSFPLPISRKIPISLTFRELNDFHPNRIIARTEAFAGLRQTRRRLEDPATFTEAAYVIGPTPRTPSPWGDEKLGLPLVSIRPGIVARIGGEIPVPRMALT